MSRSFYHRLQWDSEVLAFTWDDMEGMLLPTVHIKENWWSPTQQQVFIETAAETSLLDLGEIGTATPNNVAVEEQQSLSIINSPPSSSSLLSSSPPLWRRPHSTHSSSPPLWCRQHSTRSSSPGWQNTKSLQMCIH